MGPPAAPGEDSGEIRLLTDTDGMCVRVERGRQGGVGLGRLIGEFPGFFVKKRFPQGGGWNNNEGGYLYCFFGV